MPNLYHAFRRSLVAALVVASASLPAWAQDGPPSTTGTTPPTTTTTTGTAPPTTTVTTGDTPTTTTTQITVTHDKTTSTTTNTTPPTPAPSPVDATNSPYRLLVGTNLDFDDNIRISGLYAKVDVFLADQRRQRLRHPLDRIGFLGSIYLNQSLSGDYLQSDTISRLMTNRTLVRAQSNDTLAVVALSSLTAKSVTKVRSLGFVIHPTYRLFSSRDTSKAYVVSRRKWWGKHKGDTITKTRYGHYWEPNDIKFIRSGTSPEGTERRLTSPRSSVYFGLHLEVVRRVFNTIYTYGTPETYDTLRISKLPTQPLPYSRPFTRPTESATVFYERYYGVSLPYRYISNEIDLRFTPSLGWAYLAPSRWTRYMTATLDITERNSGITFGAEIRDFASLKEPIMGLYISKSFLLTRLGDLLSARN